MTKVKAISTCESKEVGHYICFKFVNGTLLRFDDALVNRVDMKERYKVNLIVYRRYDIDPHQWNMDLGFITHMETLGYSLRRPRRGAGFTLRHDINPYRNLWDKNNETNVSDNAMDLSAIQSEEQNVPVGNSEVPLDMSVAKSSVADNATDNISDERNGTVSNLVLNSSTQSALVISQPDTLPLPTVHYASDEQQKDLNVNTFDNNRMELSPNDDNNVNIQVDNSFLRAADVETDKSSENVHPPKEVHPDTANTDSGIDMSASENFQNSDSNLTMPLQQGAQMITNTSTMELSPNDDNNVNIQVDNSFLRDADMETDKSSENVHPPKEVHPDTANTDSGIDMSASENFQNSDSNLTMPLQQGAQTITNTSTMDVDTANMDTDTHISTCDNFVNTEPSPDITLQNGQQTTTDITNIIGDSSNIDSGIDMSTSESLQSNERPVAMPIQDGAQTITEGEKNIGETQNNDLPKIQDKVSEDSEDDETSGNVELSEFEETVDYGADSTNEQSTQETDSPVESTPKSKPDWSLRPPLITPTNKKDRAKNEKLRSSSRRIPLPKLKAKRIQPQRATKATVLYEPDSSDSDSDVSSEIDNKDEDYIPDGEKGKFKYVLPDK